jgi:hypothetical protein
LWILEKKSVLSAKIARKLIFSVTIFYFIKDLPVMSFGFSIPIMSNKVGATSAKIPFSILLEFSVTQIHGTGFKE